MAIPSIAPFTLTVMKDNLAKLNAKADAAKGKSETTEDDKELWALLRTWQWLNASRAVLVGAGTLAGHNNRQPTALELEVAEIQGKLFCETAKKLAQ